MISSRSIRRLTASTVAGAALATGLLAGSCGVATADAQQDQKFFFALRYFGISGIEPGVAVSDAHMVCAELAHGLRAVDVVDQLQVALPTLDFKDREQFAGVAIDEYCPNQEAGLH